MSQRTLYIILAILAVLACGPWASAVNIPTRPQGYVNDYAGIIQPAARQRMVSMARELERKTSAQVAIVTVSSTQPQTIERYAVSLFEQWGIGQKGKDNGALLLVALEDRKVRIETGYGLEGVLTDALSQKIISSFMIPQFKRNQFSRGIEQGAVAMISLIAQSAGVTVTGQEQVVAQQMNRPTSVAGRLINFIFTLFILMMIFTGRGGFLGWFLLGSMMGGHRRGGYWYGSGFGGSSGGFGGGFGGFGGGLSGGGGASGSW